MQIVVGAFMAGHPFKYVFLSWERYSLFVRLWGFCDSGARLSRGRSQARS